MEDWNEIRKNRFSDVRHDQWPDGVMALSLEGLTLFGIHPETDKLYWDGKEVVTRTKIRLGTFERWVASFAAAGTFGTFLVNVGRAFGLWH